MTSDCQFSNQVEPHGKRRSLLLERYPELRSWYGYDYRTSLLMILITVLQLGLAAGMSLSSFADHWLVFLLIAYFVGGTLNHWLSMGIHECAHDLGAKTAKENIAVSLIANIPLIIPGAMSFRRYHLDHHIYLGERGNDNDLPIGAEIHWVGTSTLKKLFWLFNFLPFSALTRGFISRPNRWEKINILTQITANIMIVAFLGWKALAYLFMSTIFGHGLHPVAAHWIHEHYLIDPQQETYSYYGPLNAVTFNVGYHVEHHDLMGIPGWRLPAFHKKAREFYLPLVSHRSWTWVLFNFLFNPLMGNHQRIVRKSRRLHSGSQITSYGLRAWSPTRS